MTLEKIKHHLEELKCEENLIFVDESVFRTIVSICEHILENAGEEIVDLSGYISVKDFCERYPLISDTTVYKFLKEDQKTPKNWILSHKNVMYVKKDKLINFLTEKSPHFRRRCEINIFKECLEK